MHKQLTAGFFIVLLFSSLTFADEKVPVPEPYETGELPQWLEDLTRFGLITIGTLPFTTMLIELGYKEVNYWPYVPFSGSVTLDESEQKDILMYSICTSFGCAVVDFVIQKIVQRHKRIAEQAEIHGELEIEEIESFSGVSLTVSQDVLTQSLKQSGGTLLPLPAKRSIR